MNTLGKGAEHAVRQEGRHVAQGCEDRRHCNGICNAVVPLKPCGGALGIGDSSPSGCAERGSGVSAPSHNIWCDLRTGPYTSTSPGSLGAGVHLVVYTDLPVGLRCHGTERCSISSPKSAGGALSVSGDALGPSSSASRRAGHQASSNAFEKNSRFVNLRFHQTLECVGFGRSMATCNMLCTRAGR